MTGLILLAWLVLATVFLLDGQILTAMMAEKPATRRLWLAVPVLFALVTLLLTPWGIAVLVVIAAAVLAHVGAHLVWVWRAGRQMAPAPADRAEQVAALCRHWNTPAPDAVVVGPIGPAVLGLWRQTLVLPHDLPEPDLPEPDLPDEELTAVLAHELAHVRRRDPLSLWLIGIAGTLIGWNPVARRTLDALRLEIELAADAQAVEWLGDARRYALVLGRWTLHAAGHEAPAWGAALAGRPADLVLRMQSLVEPVPAVRLLRMPAPLGAWLVRQQKRPRSRPRRRMPFAGREFLPGAIISLTGAMYLSVFLLVLWLL